MTHFDLIILGAGINGLCAAYFAIQRGIRSIALIDQFEPGHNRGSSHGRSRITRSAYANKDYVRLMQVAHDSLWPQLEKKLGTQLVYPCEGCFFGPPSSKYTRYANAVTSMGVDCGEISVEEARQRYPQFPFSNTPGVIVDRTAGLLAAHNVIAHLTSYAREHIDVITGERIASIGPAAHPIKLRSDTTTFTSDKLIVTAGPWVKMLLPTLKHRVSVARQTVGYLRLDMPNELHALGSFPVWGDLGGGDSIGYYGLPEFERPGIKVAKHVIRGRDDDPNAPKEPSDEEVKDLKAFIAKCFKPDLTEILDLETCHYTNTIDEDYIIDVHPDNPSCVIGSGFSGHGFKLGPVTGRALADLAVDGRHTCEVFDSVQTRFKLQKEAL